MKHARRILLLVVVALLLILLGLVAVILIWQWDNVRVVGTALTQSTESVVQEMEQLHEEEADFIEEQNISVQIPTMEQDKELLEGTVSPQEIKDALGINETEEPSSVRNSQTILEECVQKLYAYRIDLFAQLGELQRKWETAWYALPVEEQNTENRNEFLMAALDDCYEMEVTADRRVKTLLKECKEDLSDVGANPALADDLWTSYCEDKRAAKTYYLKQYLD